MENSRKVRLSDIAEKLGVSTVTVSKAIADKEGVSDELRERIKQLATEMGYRQKSSRFANLRGENSTGNIGILIRRFNPQTLNPLTPESQVFLKHQLNMILCAVRA